MDCHGAPTRAGVGWQTLTNWVFMPSIHRRKTPKLQPRSRSYVRRASALAAPACLAGLFACTAAADWAGPESSKASATASADDLDSQLRSLADSHVAGLAQEAGLSADVTDQVKAIFRQHVAELAPYLKEIAAESGLARKLKAKSHKSKFETRANKTQAALKAILTKDQGKVAKKRSASLKKKIRALVGL